MPRPVARPATPPPRSRETRSPEESPDPLALRPPPPPAVTPRKRKPVVELVSPSIKRIFPYQPSAQSTPFSSVPVTPSTGSTSFSKLTPKRMAYIDVPPKPWLTPKTSEKKHGNNRDASPDDLGGYGSEGDDSPSRKRSSSDLVKTSARRTGDRDDRAPLEKLIALLEDVFEAEDVLPPDVELSTLPSEFFCAQTTVDCSRPLLHSNFIRKLTKYISQVARPIKRIRHGGVLNTPRSKEGRMADVETQILSRILKMLERNVKSGEDLDPFINTAAVAAGGISSVQSSPRKPAKKAKGKKNERRSKSRTPKDEDDDREGEGDKEVDGGKTMEVDALAALTDADLDKLTTILETARDSILAADSCIALLGSDRLTKQVCIASSQRFCH